MAYYGYAPSSLNHIASWALICGQGVAESEDVGKDRGAARMALLCRRLYGSRVGGAVKRR